MLGLVCSATFKHSFGQTMQVRQSYFKCIFNGVIKEISKKCMCSELTFSLFITDILIPSYGNIFATYTTCTIRIQFAHYLLAKCPLCPLYIQNVQLLCVWSNHTCERFRREYDNNGKIITGSCRLLRGARGETTPSSSHPSDVVNPSFLSWQTHPLP